MGGDDLQLRLLVHDPGQPLGLAEGKPGIPHMAQKGQPKLGHLPEKGQGPGAVQVESLEIRMELHPPKAPFPDALQLPPGVRVSG